MWRASLDIVPPTLRRFEDSLSPDEKGRAEKFLVEHARTEFIASRGILRELLGAYLGNRANEVCMSYGKYGKPSLCASDSGAHLHFNTSHSHGYGVFAFARNEQVGVDVEQVRDEVATEEIAARFFSTAEIAELSTLAPELRVQGFFKCWTRKEAYIKARGLGLQIPLKSFHVAVITDEPQQLIDEDSSPWSLYPFEPHRGFAGAVAAKGKNWRVRYFDWERGGQNPRLMPR